MRELRKRHGEKKEWRQEGWKKGKKKGKKVWRRRKEIGKQERRRE